MPFVCMYMCCTFAHTTFSVGLNKKTTQLELAVKGWEKEEYLQ